ncbi:MAG TPA: LamG domain-containing protein [Terriglobales bacterium]|nr:LamG domain-containing protein [Terriglobales bacterium]
MKATHLLLVLASVLTLASGSLGQSISGQNPVIHGDKITWPLAFQFDGSGPTVDVGNSPALNTPTFTVSAYVEFDALSHPPGSNGDRPAGDMSIVDKISASGVDNSDGWRLLKQDDGFFWFCLGGGPGTNGCTDEAATTVISTTSPVVKVWYNVVGVLSNSEIAIYVNGVKEASKPLPSFTDTHSADMRIGSSAQGGGYAYFNGVIDNVAFYGRALSGKHIDALCTATNGGVPCH